MSGLVTWPPFIFYLGLLVLIGFGTLAVGWVMDLRERSAAAVRPAHSAVGSITGQARPVTEG